MAKATTTLAPAAAVAGTRATAPAALVPAAYAKEVQAFESAIGGRQALLAALSVTEPTKEVWDVLQLISDPRFERTPLAQLCAQARIHPGTLLAAYNAAILRKGQILARTQAVTALPDIVKDIVRTAQPHEAICPKCDGKKTITVVMQPKRAKGEGPGPELEPEARKTIECWRCDGVGTVKVAALESQQDRVLQLAELTSAPGSSSITVSAHANAAAAASSMGSLGGGSLEQLQQAMSTLLFQPPTSRTPASPSTHASSTRTDDAIPPASPAAVVDATLVEDPACVAPPSA